MDLSDQRNLPIYDSSYFLMSFICIKMVCNKTKILPKKNHARFRNKVFYLFLFTTLLPFIIS